MTDLWLVLHVALKMGEWAIPLAITVVVFYTAMQRGDR